MKKDIFSLVFTLFLLLTLILSFYIFILSIFFKDPKTLKLYSTWQFPMLLALYLDAIYT